MNTTEARVSPEELDAIQLAVGKVPLKDFRLKNDCAYCLWLMDQPANGESFIEVLVHIQDEHRDEVIVPRCPDDGTCHHFCATQCFRVRCCGPLSGVFPGDKWPTHAAPKY